jgi:hypothetical protein
VNRFHSVEAVAKQLANYFSLVIWQAFVTRYGLMAPSEQKKYDVFISHSSCDKNCAAEFEKQLKALGLRVWLDDFEIQGGRSIINSINNGLQESRTTMFLVTRASQESIWVHLEIARAFFKQDGNLVPVLLEKTDDDLRLLQIFGDIKRIDLTEPNAQKRSRNYHALLDMLLTKANLSKPDVFPSPPPFRTDKSFELVAGGYALAIGAHWDDILLGCFGLLLKLKLCFHYRVKTLVLCNDYGRYFGEEQLGLHDRSQRIYGQIGECSGIQCVFVEDREKELVFPDRKFHANRELLDGFLRRYAQDPMHEDANLILLPPSDDHHEDHAITSTLAMSHFRGPHQTVLEYEIKPHSDRAFVPNLFVGLSEKMDCSKLKGMLYEKGERTVAELKMKMLTKLVLDESETCVKGAKFLFGDETLRARMRINALDYGGDKTVWHGEAFRGSVHL